MIALCQLDRGYIRQSMSLGREIFLNHGGWLLAALPLLLMYVKRTVYLWFATLMVFSIVLTSYFNPFIFGATRLDHNRSTTQMIVYIILVLGLYLYSIKSNRKKLIIATIIVIPSLWYYNKLGYHPKALCCNTKSFDKTRVKFQKIAQLNEINLPTVSNPDLGVLSWHKKFNIIDIGRLGSPIMAHLKANKKLFKEYYLHYALPDMIELHNGWSCGYAFLLQDDEFKKLYRPYHTQVTKWTKNNCKEHPLSESGIWIRRNIEKESNSNERNFLDNLQVDLKMESIIEEFTKCYKYKNNECRYITRVLYHLLPVIKEKNLYNEVLSLAIEKSIDPYSLYLLEGFYKPLKYKEALQYIKKFDEKGLD